MDPIASNNENTKTNMNEDLTNYVSQSRASGQTDEQIKQALSQSGWNQGQINEVLGVPVPPGVTPVPPVASAGLPVSEFFDQKTKDTMMWAVVGYFVRSLIVTVAGAVAGLMFVSPTLNIYGMPVSLGYRGFNIDMVSLVLSSIVGGAIFGLILSKFYGIVQDINRRFFGGWFNSLFKLIFYPSLIAGVLSVILGGGIFAYLFGGTGFAGYFFISLVVTISADVIGSYVFARIMVSKVGQYYS